MDDTDTHYICQPVPFSGPGSFPVGGSEPPRSQPVGGDRADEDGSQITIMIDLFDHTATVVHNKFGS